MMCFMRFRKRIRNREVEEFSETLQEGVGLEVVGDDCWGGGRGVLMVYGFYSLFGVKGKAWSGGRGGIAVFFYD